MKKYFEPEMNISTFSSENVVTTSGNNPIGGKGSTAVDYGEASNKTSVSYTDFVNALAFN